MKTYLGVDSGGTKTKFLLVNEKGQMLAISNQNTSHYLQVGLPGVARIMQAGLDDCLLQANIKKDQLQAVFASCAGYGDIEGDSIAIEETIQTVFGDIPCRVGNDVENAYAGALGGKRGIVVIAGTGSIGFGMDDQNSKYRCGGWHHAFGGDEGSAYWIACRLILAYTRQSDGRDAKTTLYDYINQTYKFQNDSDILALTVQDWDFDRTRVADMAKHVSILANQHDPVALQIFHDAAKELADIYLTIKNRLQFDGEVLASYVGGVFRSGEHILAPLRSQLAEAEIRLVPPMLGPDGGSALLALQLGRIQIDEEVLANLKQEN